MERFSCYHPRATKDNVPDLFTSKPVGSYVIRPSSTNGTIATISLLTRSGINHIRIENSQPGSLYLSGPTDRRKYFENLHDLMNYYTKPGRKIYLSDNNSSNWITAAMIHPINRANCIKDSLLSVLL